MNDDMARWFTVPETGRNLVKRVVSAIILGAAFIAAVVAGGIAFDAVVIAVALLCFREWSRLRSGAVHSIERWGPLALIPLPLVVAPIWGPAPSLALTGLIAATIFGAFRARNRAAPGYTAFGFLYVTVPALSVLWLRDQPDEGLGLLLWFCATIWVNDIAAFASGRTIGGPKLAPTISPAKTWAGFAGGVVGAIMAGGIASWLLGWPAPAIVMMVSAALAMVAQCGDLFESAVKRHFGVKDSGMLIPGHGGALDRMDGFMAAAPVAALIYAGFGDAVGW